MLRLYNKSTPPLGDLERDVLEVIWASQGAGAQHVHDVLSAQRPITLSTVQSTVERLVRKGLLHREKAQRAYVYSAAISREALLARLVAELVSDLSDTRMPSASAGVVDLSKSVDAQTLDQLEHWVAKHRIKRVTAND